MKRIIFDMLLNDYCQRFQRHGAFELARGDNIRERLREEGVPEEPGVYLIYGRRGNEEHLLYIGRAGTLRKDGTFKDQKLDGRLKAKQQGRSRAKFYQEQLTHLGLDSLVFRWFVTFSENVTIIPAKAEADLLQAYFDEQKRLPDWNESL